MCYNFAARPRRKICPLIQGVSQKILVRAVFSEASSGNQMVVAILISDHFCHFPMREGWTSAPLFAASGSSGDNKSAASKYDAMHRKCLCLMPMSTNSVVKTHQSSCCCLLPPTTSPQQQKHGENIGFLPSNGCVWEQSFQRQKGSHTSSWKHCPRALPSHTGPTRQMHSCVTSLLVRLSLTTRKCLLTQSQRKDGIIVTIWVSDVEFPGLQ